MYRLAFECEKGRPWFFARHFCPPIGLFVQFNYPSFVVCSIFDMMFHMLEFGWSLFLRGFGDKQFVWNCCQIFEKNPTTIKNFGIWLRYQSRTGYHNMYKEYRDTTLNGAVEQMYIEMASRHRVRFPCIQIIKTATIPAKLCKRESTKQFHNSKIKFPLVFRKVRPPSRKLKTTYKASRPNLFV